MKTQISYGPQAAGRAAFGHNPVERSADSILTPRPQIDQIKSDLDAIKTNREAMEEHRFMGKYEN